MQHPLQCDCGHLKGVVSHPERLIRGVCYCQDCRTFVRVLGRKDLLDDAGGTEILACQPQRVTFTEGQDALTCLSLTPRGLIRWYASCCNTPVGNTVRDSRLSFVGLSAASMSHGPTSLEESLGPVQLRSWPQYALKPAPRTNLRVGVRMAGLTLRVFWTWISGGWKNNPFFSGGQPIVAPTLVERTVVESARDPS